MGIIYELKNVTMRKKLLLIVLLASAMAAKAQREKYDLNGDGKVNVADVTALVNYIFTPSYKSCPDSKHPHWIDLGLPSGTLWRCCNEGASTPEGYGDYYSFDERPSSTPSLIRIIELFDHTTYEWTTVNGVNGGKFTGSNGGTIFLPAVGYHEKENFYYVGLNGRYWSNNSDGAYFAYGFDFSSKDKSWSSFGYNRLYGLSVRPVH